ncbi:MAG: FG-GAP repeat domain-containing protein [Acidobacteriota bacterium]
MRSTVLFLLGVLIALAVAVSVVMIVARPAGTGSGPAGHSSAGPVAGDTLPESMEIVEEPTEAFANTLLDCSLALRGGDAAGMADCFTDELDGTPFPSAPGPLAAAGGTGAVEWIGRHTWSLAPPASLTRASMLASVDRFMSHFSRVEDVRLKVKHSEILGDGARVRGHLKVWLVGRDEEGHREWVRGEADAEARPEADGTWRMDRFELTGLSSMVARRDLFSEVATAAGFDRVDPPVLEHPTLGLAAYGAAAADVNGDGLVDIVMTSHTGNALYLNEGNGRFHDAAADAWVATLPRPGTMPLFVDFDNDGDPDLFLSSVGEQFLFENRLVPEGRLVFRDVSLPSGVSRDAVGFSAAAGDVNGDGFPDIYVASYNHYGQVVPDHWDAATNGTPNLLFINQGDGTFKEEAATWGVADSRWSYAASFADVDGDGHLDLYVANDFGGGNGLYHNDGTHFVDVAADRGVYDGGYGMGVSFGDYDNDGDLDLHVTRMSSTAGRRILARIDGDEMTGKEHLENLAAGNALYENLGDGSFREVTATAGPFSAGWAWGGGFFDLDNDGWQDLYTPNGFLSGKSMKDT